MIRYDTTLKSDLNQARYSRGFLRWRCYSKLEFRLNFRKLYADMAYSDTASAAFKVGRDVDERCTCRKRRYSLYLLWYGLRRAKE